MVTIKISRTWLPGCHERNSQDVTDVTPRMSRTGLLQRQRGFMSGRMFRLPMWVEQPANHESDEPSRSSRLLSYLGMLSIADWLLSTRHCWCYSYRQYRTEKVRYSQLTQRARFQCTMLYLKRDELKYLKGFCIPPMITCIAKSIAQWAGTGWPASGRGSQLGERCKVG